MKRNRRITAAVCYSILAFGFVALTTQCTASDNTTGGGGSTSASTSTGAESTTSGGGSTASTSSSTTTSTSTSTSAGSSSGSGGPTEGPFTFLAYGDSRAGNGCDGNTAHIALASRMNLEPNWDFVVHLGDMTTGYDASTCFAAMGDCTDPKSHGNFSSIISALKARPAPPGLPSAFIPVIGNHDDNLEWYPDKCGGKICDVFDLGAFINHPTPHNDPCNADYPTQAYYTLRYKGVLFIVLRINSDYFNLFECNNPQPPYTTCDDYCAKAPPSPTRSDQCYNVHQYDWLKGVLTAADGDPTIHHRVVMLHAPVYTSYNDHQAVTSAHILTSLIDQHHVDLVLSGHNHTYERTVPIKGGAKASGGAVYITTGHGGSEGGAPDGAWFTAAMSGAYHYMRLHVDGPTISGTAIGIDGSTLDSF